MTGDFSSSGVENTSGLFPNVLRLLANHLETILCNSQDPNQKVQIFKSSHFQIKYMRDDKNNLIVELTFDFALTIISFSEELEAMRKYNMANQLFRSGTSIGANTWESQNAESKADFIHKLKIAAKEADETKSRVRVLFFFVHTSSDDSDVCEIAIMGFEIHLEV